jgi:hypothetical protein
MTTTTADDPRTEVPRYRATRDVHPSPNSRHHFEPPFASFSDSDVWQYATRIVNAREEIETREWPHPSFFPLNDAAKRVHSFFTTRQKSRLPRSPWRVDRIVLDDGLSGPTQPKFPIKTGATAA